MVSLQFSPDLVPQLGYSVGFVGQDPSILIVFQAS
jgi:hypothetical protein